MARPVFGQGDLSLDPARSVFINCPFDEEYAPLFDAVVFATVCCGFIPRSALESGTVSETRVARIVRALVGSKYSIHNMIFPAAPERGPRTPRDSTCPSNSAWRWPGDSSTRRVSTTGSCWFPRGTPTANTSRICQLTIRSRTTDPYPVSLRASRDGWRQGPTRCPPWADVVMIAIETAKLTS